MGRGIFVNVVEAALGELEQAHDVRGQKSVARGGPSWGSKLFALLELHFEQSTPTIDLLRAEHGDPVIDDLEAALRGKGHYDLQRIYPLLLKVRGSPSTRIIEEALLDELLGQGDRRRLSEFAWLLARRALEGLPAKDLKDLPKQTLARTYASLLLESRAGDLTENFGGGGEVMSEIAAVWREILAEAQLESVSLVAGPASLLDAFGDSFFWHRLAHRYLEDLGMAWAEARRSDAPNAGDGASAHPTASPEGGLNAEKLGRDAVRGFAGALLRRVLHVGSRSAERRISEIAKPLGRRLHEHLARAGLFAERTSLGGETYDDVLVARTVDATIEASVRHLSEEIAERMTAEASPATLREIGSRLEGALARDADRGTLQREEAYAETLARKDVQRDLGGLLIPLSEDVLAQATALGASWSDGAQDLTGEASLSRFWERWKAVFAERFRGKGFGGFESLPWEDVSEKDLRLLIQELIQRFAGPEEEWIAVFRVTGLDLGEYGEDSALRVGGVTFYDPDTYDFGEGRWKLWDEKPPGPYAVARTRVEADNPAGAERAGLRALADALNVLTFAYSDARRDMGGVKGDVLPGTYVLRSDGTSGQYRPRSRGARTPRVALTSERDPARLVSAYRELLASRRDDGTPGEIRPGFLRALHWYARGYWEPDPTQRFLAHWIGLEHLFVAGGPSKGALVDEVPKLTLNWRQLRGLMFTGMTLREIVGRAEKAAHLREKADARPNLEGWNDDSRVLLNPAKAKLLALLASEHEPDLAERLRGFVVELRELAYDHEAVAEEVEFQREQESFKLVLLKGARNKIVHEARREHPNIDAFAEKIERVLADVLDRIVVEVVKEKPDYAFVAQLADSDEKQPWLEGKRGMPVTEEGIARLRSARRRTAGGGRFEDDSTDLVKEGRAERPGVLWS